MYSKQVIFLNGIIYFYFSFFKFFYFFFQEVLYANKVGYRKLLTYDCSCPVLVAIKLVAYKNKKMYWMSVSVHEDRQVWELFENIVTAFILF